MLRLSVVMVMMVVLIWEGLVFAGVDRAEIAGAVGEARPVRFLQVDDETLERVQQRLEQLEALPTSVNRSPSVRNFGREQLFYPDKPAAE